MTSYTPPTKPGKPGTRPFLRALLGLLLLFPACALCSVNSFGLTIQTFLGSLQSPSFLKPGEFVGIENYVDLLDNPIFSASIGSTALSVFLRLLVATIFPLLLVLFVNSLGRRSSLGGRLFFTLPLTFFAPALVVLASSGMRWMWNRDAPEQTYLLIEILATLAVSCAIGLIVYRATLNQRGASEKDWKSVLKPLIVLWVVGQLAVAAYALQSFTPLHAALNPSTKSLASLINQAIRLMNSGTAYAVSTIIFSFVAAFGIIATLILLLSRMQLENITPGESLALPKNRLLNVLGWVAVVIGVVAVLFTVLLPLLISFAGIFSSVGATSARAVSLPKVWVNTVLPPLLVAFFVQLPVAYIGAFGIGAVRPLGKWSEWLLLLFSPWLFVTSLPVAVAAFQNAHKLLGLNSFLALFPPLFLSVPILFVLTLFFKGQEEKWRQSREEGTSTTRATLKQMVLPSLPLALFLAAVSFLVSMQDLFMPMLVGVGPENSTASTAILRFIGASNQLGAQKVITLIGLPVLFVLLVAFGALQIFYFDRLSITQEAVGNKQDEQTLNEATDSPAN